MNYVALATELGIQGFIANKEYRAKCPLHDDSNPSFSLNTEHGSWICFSGCGSGDFFRLVELTLGCSPQEARDWIASNGKRTSVEQLSEQLNRELNKPEPTTVVQELNWRKRYFSLVSDVMPVWFLKRGFTWQTIQHWKMKYDPAYDAVTIPAFWKGELVGTITRHTYPGMPKYQNSPEFPRADILFGEISTARSDIILCEGVLDAIWLWQNGFNGVALLGTFLSQHQLEALREYRFGEIILALDNDDAGRSGIFEAVNRLTKMGWLLPQIRVMEFPENRKDPQECSKEELIQAYEGRKDVTNNLIMV